MVGGPLVVADAAAFGLVTTRDMGSDSDAQVMAPTSSQFQDTTSPGSIRNIRQLFPKRISSRIWKSRVTEQPGAAMRPYLIMG